MNKLTTTLAKYLLVAFMLAFTANSFAQETTANAITPTGVVTDVQIELPTHYINPTLKPYVNTFFAGLVADGWGFTNVKANDIFILFDYEIDKDLDKSLDHKGAAGIALGMNNDDVVYVVINIDGWLKLEEYEKQDLINHELMHDIYNVEHTNKEREEKLMHPSSYPKSWAETMYRFIDAIKDLNLANGY